MVNKKHKSKNEYLNQALTLLEQGTTAIFESQKYRDYLICCSRFHRYSLNNTILIWTQMPGATQVAGYTTWQKMGRYPKRNMKGIRILAPTPYQVKKVEREEIDETTGEPVKKVVDVNVLKFKAVTVFDISQTEGEPIPTLAEELQGDVKGYKNLVKALICTSDVPVLFEEISGRHGYYSRKENRIVVNAGMSEKQTVKTLIHEEAHSILHHDADISISREQKEVEAESVAFVVSNYYGIDTSDYSFEYVAAWSKEKELPELKKSLEVIRKTASKIINRTDKQLAFLTASKEKHKVKSQESIEL